MFAANPFFKREMPRTREYTYMDRQRDQELQAVRDKYNNDSAVRVDGHPRFGFKTMLTGSKVPLPTAPSIVGGNVDWTTSKVTPVTHKLFDTLMTKRPMGFLPALGSPLRLGEPNQNSIHSTL